jgi:hypothetical protein
MKSLPLPALLWCFLALMFPLPLQAAPPVERRALADRAMELGNWNDALKIWRDILPLPDNTGVHVATDLGKALQCVQQLNQLELWDAVVEDTVKAHPGDWILLRDAGLHYQNTQAWGTIVSGEFRRGQYQGGKRVSSAQRDRVRSLQLFEQAMMAMQKADVTADQQSGFYTLFVQSVSAVEGWELQSLTDLSKLPDFEEQGGGGYGGPGWGWESMTPRWPARGGRATGMRSGRVPRG